MEEQRQRLARGLAGLVVLGTLVIGAVAPSDAAASSAGHQAPSHMLQPADTGWNGT